MEWDLILVCIIGLTVAGIIKGVTGLGYASCALPFLVFSLGLKTAMATVIIPAMATNMSVALNSGHLFETWHRFKLLYVAMLPGIVGGVALLMWIDQALSVTVLGVIIILYACIALARPNMVLPRSMERPLQIPVGFFNGVVTGLTGAQVMPLFPYMMSLDLEPGRMVQAINLAVMLASTVLALALLATGILTPRLLAASCFAVAPALLGVEAGIRLRALIAPDRFKRIVLATLMLSGMLMLLRPAMARAPKATGEGHVTTHAVIHR
jgi:uncharacterized protein